MSHTTVPESWRGQGLRTRAAKTFRCTTDSGYSVDVATNLLAKDPSLKRRDKKWASDITYLRSTQGWLYLAVVMDLYIPKIIGWATSTRIVADLAGTALRAA